MARAEKLGSCVDRILHSEGVPPFCKNAQEVMVRTLDLETNSRDLVRIILKDVGLASQILRVANSATYNRSGRSIMSIAHAMVMLGWDRVRSLVSTVRFIEHFAERSPGLRELMLLSVLSAVHSRDLALAIGYPQPEEAYLCGLFRNLGEVLIACHYPMEYSMILLAMQRDRIPAQAACLRYLDFPWDEVGLEVAARWNMPSRIRRCLAGTERPVGSILDRSVGSITGYARELTHALYRDGAGIEAVHLKCVVDTEGRQTLVSVRDLYRITESALSETRETFSALGIPAKQLLLERQAERALAMVEQVRTFDADHVAALDQAVNEAVRRMNGRDFELTSFVTGMLEAVKAAGFDRAVFGLMNEDHMALRGRLASGERSDELLARFVFTTDRADGLIRAAFQRRSDVLVDRGRDDRYDASELVRSLAPAAFALFPLVVDGQAAGCLYADRLMATPNLENIRLSLGRVRNAIAAAIRKMAQRSAPSKNGRG